MIDGKSLDESTLVSTIGGGKALPDDLDAYGYEVAFRVSDENGAGVADLWERVKHEFRTLICTDDKEYKDVRERLAKITPSYTTAVVSIISAALGAAIGAAAATIAPLVALLLLVLTRVGHRAVCSMEWGAS